MLDQSYIEHGSPDSADTSPSVDDLDSEIDLNDFEPMASGYGPHALTPEKVKVFEAIRLQYHKVPLSVRRSFALYRLAQLRDARPEALMKELYCIAAVESGFGASGSGVQNFFLDFQRKRNDIESVATEPVTFRGMLSDPLFRAELRDHIVVHRRPKGEKRLHLAQLTRWVNTELLPKHRVRNPSLFSHPTVVVETVRTWILKMGFRYERDKSGDYVDGHERDDVILARADFVRWVEERDHKDTVFIYQDETCINVNDASDTGTWTEIGAPKDLEKKSPGQALMLSCFWTVDGELELSPVELEEATAAALVDPTWAAFLVSPPDWEGEWRGESYVEMKIGKNNDGYFTNELFLQQVDRALLIARWKYRGKKIVWLFDQSGVHIRFAEDSLNAAVMNLKPGGKQPIPHDTTFIDPVSGERIQQTFADASGVAKGARQILEERGLWSPTMGRAEAQAILAEQTDFREEVCLLESKIRGAGHEFKLIPKFHCEFNPSELVWALLKRWVREQCQNTWASLRKNAHCARRAISAQNCENFFRKCSDFRKAYLYAGATGDNVKAYVKAYKKVRKSHPTILLTNEEYARALANFHPNN